MTQRVSLGELGASACVALELDGINAPFAQDEQRRSDAFFAHEPPRSATPVSIEDWDTLFDAIKARLTHAVDQTLIGQYNGAAAPLRVTVLECVDALDHLHALLRGGRTRRARSAGAGTRHDDAFAQQCAAAATVRATAGGRAAPSAAPAPHRPT